MKRALTLFTALLLLTPLAVIHPAGPRDTLPESWAATDEWL